jgi:hypothetical protein
MLHCTYTFFEEAIREFDSGEVGSIASAIRAFAFGLALLLTEMVRQASAKEFLRPLSDYSLVRMMMLNIRPGTPDVAYFRRVVKVVTAKGIMGVCVFIAFHLFPLWRENGGDGAIFFVARDPTPQLVLLSVGLVVARANIHVMFFRALLYSLATRCVCALPYKNISCKMGEDTHPTSFFGPPLSSPFSQSWNFAADFTLSVWRIIFSHGQTAVPDVVKRGPSGR